jgi:spore coat polysaccharide biosynthesis protein SpsF
MTAVGAVVQARIGSSRLPGKVLLDIGGRTMLERVISRVRRASTLDAVIVATSHAARDDAVATEAKRLGVGVWRGNEDDVLDRYHGAARHFDLDWIVRITSDCPLIDPGLIDLVVERCLAARPVVDFASNTIERTWPRGLDVAVMRRPALERAWREATTPRERVHVTPYLREHPELFVLLSVTGGPGADQRWTVDTAEDLEFVRMLYRRLGNGDTFSWQDAIEVIRREPDLLVINERVRQKELGEL